MIDWKARAAAAADLDEMYAVALELRDAHPIEPEVKLRASRAANSLRSVIRKPTTENEAVARLRYLKMIEALDAEG